MRMSRRRRRGHIVSKAEVEGMGCESGGRGAWVVGASGVQVAGDMGSQREVGDLRSEHGGVEQHRPGTLATK